MNRLSRILLIVAFSLPALLCDAADRPRPNIVVILADDFGVGDIHALYPSNKLVTPNLDKLVSEGMHFTDAHSGSAVCSPTRYGLLTGRYAWRTRLEHWVLACYEPPLIDEHRLTLPAYLRQHGYQTAAFGKWHLGWNWPGPQPSRMDETNNALATLEWDFTKRIPGGPTDRGFDTYFGVDAPNFPPMTFIENDRVTALPTAKFRAKASKKNPEAGGFDGAAMAPSWKFDQILPEITRRVVNYIHTEAETKKPFFLYFALTSPHAPVAVSKQFAGKSGIAPIVDFLMETDWSAGQVLQAIDDAGIRDNTIVIFAGDNGHGTATGWDNLLKAGLQPSGPYRGAKGDLWEGGHRVPLVVRWPGHIAADSTSKQLVCLNDVFATCADVLGDKLPDDAAEDSFSFLPAALNHNAAGAKRTSLVNHSGIGEFALRDNNWKLAYFGPARKYPAARGKATVAKLYNLDDDIAEKHDVASEHPEIVEKLTAKLHTLVDNGRSRPGPPEPNDRKVRFDIIPTERWAPPLN